MQCSLRLHALCVRWFFPLKIPEEANSKAKNLPERVRVRWNPKRSVTVVVAFRRARPTLLRKKQGGVSKEAKERGGTCPGGRGTGIPGSDSTGCPRWIFGALPGSGARNPCACVCWSVVRDNTARLPSQRSKQPARKGPACASSLKKGKVKSSGKKKGLKY